MAKALKPNTSSWVLVTGASQGIGAAICERLSEKGWSVILVSRRLKTLKSIAANLKSKSVSLEADLSSEASILKLKQDIEKIVGNQGLKALVNNAGLYEREAFLKTSDKSWTDQLAVNLLGPARLAKSLYPLLIKAKPASIVNVSSTLGYKPVPMTAAYSASKAALNSLTQALAVEWAPNVRVNAVCPGLIDTPIHDFHKMKDSTPLKKEMHKLQPMERLGQPEDIAAMVDFLLSDDSQWTTGALMTVDGGIQLK